MKIKETIHIILIYNKNDDINKIISLIEKTYEIRLVKFIFHIVCDDNGVEDMKNTHFDKEIDFIDSKRFDRFDKKKIKEITCDDEYAIINLKLMEIAEINRVILAIRNKNNGKKDCTYYIKNEREDYIYCWYLEILFLAYIYVQTILELLSHFVPFFKRFELRDEITFHKEYDEEVIVSIYPNIITEKDNTNMVVWFLSKMVQYAKWPYTLVYNLALSFNENQSKSFNFSSGDFEHGQHQFKRFNFVSLVIYGYAIKITKEYFIVLLRMQIRSIITFNIFTFIVILIALRHTSVYKSSSMLRIIACVWVAQFFYFLVWMIPYIPFWMVIYIAPYMPIFKAFSNEFRLYLLKRTCKF